MRGQWSTTCKWCTTGWAWCATSAMIAHQQHPTLSATMASNQGRKTLMNQFHQNNYQMRQNHHSQGPKLRGQDGMVSIRLPCQGYPYLPMQPWGRNQQIMHHLPTHISCYLFSHMTQPSSSLLPLNFIKWSSKLTTKTINVKSWVLNNTAKNCGHNDHDGYIVLIKTMIVTMQVDNIH